MSTKPVPRSVSRARLPQFNPQPLAFICYAGTDPPLSAPDSGAYPPWLFELLEDKPILADHLQKGLENVPAADLKSVIRQINRKRIKDGNDVRRKK